jgi:predicted RNA-binding Zn ribbon-like protein
VPLTPPGQRTLHVEALELRTDLDRLFHAFASGTTLTGNALFNVNRALRGSFRSSRLVIVDGRPVLRERHESNGPVAVLAPIATAAATLMTEADPGRLRQCAGAACTRWFLDTSKGGQRQWCSMAACGNRAKSARFRARSGPGPDAAAPPAPSA